MSIRNRTSGTNDPKRKPATFQPGPDRSALGPISDPAEVWEALKAVVEAGRTEEPNLYYAAVGSVQGKGLAFVIDIQIMAGYIVGTALRMRIGEKPSEEQIEIYSQVIGKRISRVMRADSNTVRWLLLSIYRKLPEETPIMPLDQLYLIGCAAAGIALGGAIGSLDQLREKAIGFFQDGWLDYVSRQQSRISRPNG